MSTLLTSKAAHWRQKQCVGVRKKPVEMYVLTTAEGFLFSLKTKKPNSNNPVKE